MLIPSALHNAPARLGSRSLHTARGQRHTSAHAGAHRRTTFGRSKTGFDRLDRRRHRVASSHHRLRHDRRTPRRPSLLPQWVADIGLSVLRLDPRRESCPRRTRHVALGDYVVAMIGRKRRAPDESLMSTLIVAEEGGDRLSYDELVARGRQSMLGALDTARSALSIACGFSGRMGAHGDARCRSK